MIDKTGLTPAVEIRGLSKKFGEQYAVKPLDLAVQQNEFFSILGPSGCGKTTLMRMITGFEQPTSGRVLLGGEDVTEMPTRKRDLNMLFQSYALFPHLSVFENVVFELRVRKMQRAIADAKAREALELVQLGHLADRKPGQLSGGQRQRVALARAVVSQPKVVLLDEPLGALDQKLRRDMQLELKRMQRETGLTFIYVTHDQEEALTMSDRIAVMSAGVVQQVAPPQDIYNSPATRFVAGFIGSCNIFDVRVPTAAAGEVVSVDLGQGMRVQAVSDRELHTDTAAALTIRPERVRIHSTQQESTFSVVGVVEQLVFLGEDWHAHVRVGEHLIKSSIPSAKRERELPGLEVGANVWLDWHPEDARLISED